MIPYSLNYPVVGGGAIINLFKGTAFERGPNYGMYPDSARGLPQTSSWESPCFEMALPCCCLDGVGVLKRVFRWVSFQAQSWVRDRTIFRLYEMFTYPESGAMDRCATVDANRVHGRARVFSPKRLLLPEVWRR